MQQEFPPKMPTPPGVPAPAGTCDTHTHVYGPFGRFPVHHPATYPLLSAPAATHREAMETLGAARAILVQPAPYGNDCSAIVDAIAAGKGALRGIGATDAGISDDELQRLKMAGICGLRFVEITLPNGASRYPGAYGFDDLVRLAPRLREHGLHAQLWANCDRLARDADMLTGLGIPVVIEHVARAEIGRGVDHPDFQTVVRLLQEGLVWMKLVVCRLDKTHPQNPEIRPYHDALVAANAERLLWGSDWPYVGMGESTPDAGSMLDLFDDWIGGDATLRRRILVDNPQKLYGFESL